MSGKKVIHRYSYAFKQKVVTEIERGELTLAQARKLYDISGGQTIQKWIKKFGKNHLLSKVVRIEMKDETDKLKELERQKQQLESALAQAHLKIICLESTLECVNEHYNIDAKKNFGTKQQHDQLKQLKTNPGDTQ
jgi:transposase-like protein